MMSEDDEDVVTAMTWCADRGAEARIGDQRGATDDDRRDHDDHDVGPQRRAVQRRSNRAADRVQRREGAVVQRPRCP